MCDGGSPSTAPEKQELNLGSLCLPLEIVGWNMFIKTDFDLVEKKRDGCWAGVGTRPLHDTGQGLGERRQPIHIRWQCRVAWNRAARSRQARGGEIEAAEGRQLRLRG